jgi:DNA topoisomerase-1
MPGQELFCYEDEDGQTRDVTSQDVNEYLRTIAGDDFTAKDFRTWAGTVLAAIALREFERVMTQKQARKNIVTAIEAVAQTLGNTPAVCRKCYIHPTILDSYLGGDTIETIRQGMGLETTRTRRGLKPEEASVLVLLGRKPGKKTTPKRSA